MTNDKCDLLSIEDALEVLDRRASIALSLGVTAKIGGMELRKLVKAARGLSAAKAAYNYQREKLEMQEVWLLRWGCCAMVTLVALRAVAEMVGLV